MLTLTPGAREIVRVMLAEAGAPQGAGLRIAADQGGDGAESLSLALAEAPEDGDEVLGSEDAPVFLEASAAELLDGAILDAHRHDDHVHFELATPDEDGEES
jgi:Fe-S cluster assembly iron-binding protein IscA